MYYSMCIQLFHLLPMGSFLCYPFITERKIYPFHPLNLSGLEFAPCELLGGGGRVLHRAKYLNCRMKFTHLAQRDDIE